MMLISWSFFIVLLISLKIDLFREWDACDGGQRPGGRQRPGENNFRKNITLPPNKKEKKRRNFVITIPATFSNINQHLTYLGWEKGYFSNFRPGVRLFVGWFVHFLNNAWNCVTLLHWAFKHPIHIGPFYYPIPVWKVFLVLPLTQRVWFVGHWHCGHFGRHRHWQMGFWTWTKAPI